MSQMRRVAFAACTAAAMIVPTAGLAQGPFGGPDTVAYIGGSVGQSMADNFCDDTAVPGSNCDDKSTAWSVFIGAQIHRNFAIEVGYREFGEMAVTVPGSLTSIDAKAFELLGVGILPIGDKLALYGKLGAYFGETDNEVSTPLGVTPGKDSNINLTYGAGAEWEFMKQLRLRVEYQRYQEMSGSDVHLDAVSLGLVYRFK
jgi:OOP family OmpA-OmpF porin